MFPSACARYRSTGHTVLLVLPRIVTPVAVQVAIRRGLSGRIAIRTISFLHVFPERDITSTYSIRTTSVLFHCIFTSFPSEFSILSLWSSKRRGRNVFILCKEIDVTLFIVSVKELGNDSQLFCSAWAIIQALHTDPNLKNPCLDVGCWPFWKEGTA